MNRSSTGVLGGILSQEEQKNNVENFLEEGVHSSPIPILARSRRVSPIISPTRNSLNDSFNQ